MRMVGVKFSSVLFLVTILAVMGWFMQSLLGTATVEAAGSENAVLASVAPANDSLGR